MRSSKLCTCHVHYFFDNAVEASSDLVGGLNKFKVVHIQYRSYVKPKMDFQRSVNQVSP